MTNTTNQATETTTRGMRTYEIREEGYTFARISARTPQSALNKAERGYPRRASEYNGYKGPVTWRAFLASDPHALASKVVTVR